MLYNLTALDNGTNIYSMFTAVNTIANEWLVAGFVLVLWVIIFVSIKNYETITAFRTSSFIVSVNSDSIFVLNLLSIQIAMIPIIMTGLSVFYSMITT